ncbi:MAG: phosphopyruvate hydratase [Patescibacteria group bacterium]
MQQKIAHVWAREILDSRGNPTVEVELTIGEHIASASVPSGASTGQHEAHELRDNDPARYDGLGVLQAVAHVNEDISKEIIGQALDQNKLDNLLIKLDGTPDKHRLGANAILAVSMAFARAMALAQNQELYAYLGELVQTTHFTLPQPLINIINGGKHADSGLDIQEFMLIPKDFVLFRDKIRVGSEIFHTLKDILHKENYAVGVGDEGGFAPHLESNEQALDLMVRAISEAGYTTDQVRIGLDAAASSFYKDGAYHLNAAKPPQKLTADELLAWYQKLNHAYPLNILEDGFAEDDWAGFQSLNTQLGKQLLIVGDDLTVTNTKRIELAIQKQAINAVLIKLNQIGTVTETLAAINLTKQAGWQPIISHRSGETTDTFIADLAVGTAAPYLKSGSMSRGERIAKYDRLLVIEDKISG